MERLKAFQGRTLNLEGILEQLNLSIEIFGFGTISTNDIERLKIDTTAIAKANKWDEDRGTCNYSFRPHQINSGLIFGTPPPKPKRKKRNV